MRYMRSGLTGQTLSSFTADDGVQLVLTRCCIVKVGGYYGRKSSGVVSRSSHGNPTTMRSLLTSNRGNQAVRPQESQPLADVRASYNGETGNMHIESPFFSWDVDAGRDGMQPARAQQFIRDVNALTCTPRYF